MAAASTPTNTSPTEAPVQGGWSVFYEQRIEPIVLYAKRNPPLIVGIALLAGLMIFVGLGHLFYDHETFRPLSVPTRKAPSWDYPFGTDTQGRDLFAVAIRGTTLTLRIGIIAGLVAVVLGTIFAFVAAYYRGWVDAVIRVLTDVGLTIPPLLILILIAINIKGGLTVDQMGLAISTVAWVFPARTIRSQVLVLREKPYVEIAKLSGTSGLSIIFKEMMPNLTPYITASFVTSVAAGILASIGLEAIGLGPFSAPTLGMTIYWNIQFSSLILKMWWWWLPPVMTIIIVFVGLFMISAGLDEWSNPRLRRSV
jgi:peptide/nickel transport system permease protein